MILHKPLTRDVDFNFVVYVSHCMIYGILGLVLGVFINNFFKKFFAGEIMLVAILLQMFILVCLIYIIHKYVNVQFVDDLQGYVAGLFFVAFYFGTQTHIFNYFA